MTRSSISHCKYIIYRIVVREDIETTCIKGIHIQKLSYHRSAIVDADNTLRFSEKLNSIFGEMKNDANAHIVGILFCLVIKIIMVIIIVVRFILR